jgi:hypothetical protein
MTALDQLKQVLSTRLSERKRAHCHSTGRLRVTHLFVWLLLRACP